MGRIQCKHCAASTWSSRDVARLAGWRMFKGTSVTGKELDDVACPRCAGTANPDAKLGWRVRCDTCDWSSEEDGDDDPYTAKDAKQAARYHECEPRVEIAPPAGDQWYDPLYVNDDGTLREPRSAKVAADAAPH